MTKFTATVSVFVEIELDETKFDEAFMEEFRHSFYRFHTIEHHAEHIAQLEARGLLDSFTEGYGEIKDFGIEARTVDLEVNDLMRATLPRGASLAEGEVR